MKEILLDAKCYAFIASLVDVIEAGLRNADGIVTVDLSALRGIFAQRCLQEDVSIVFQGNPPGTVPDRRGELEQSYVQMLAGLSQAAARRPVYPLCELTDPAACASAALLAEAQPFKLSSPVEAAIAATHSNLQLTHSRIAALDFLQRIGGRRGWQTPSAVSIAATARQALYAGAVRYELAYTQLVLISGDLGQLERLRQAAVKGAFSREMSVIEHLSVDGQIPGRYSSETENSFREDIKRRMESSLQLSLSPSN
jgi:hypothetical protein